MFLLLFSVYLVFVPLFVLLFVLFFFHSFLFSFHSQRKKRRLKKKENAQLSKKKDTTDLFMLAIALCTPFTIVMVYNEGFNLTFRS